MNNLLLNIIQPVLAGIGGKLPAVGKGELPSLTGENGFDALFTGLLTGVIPGQQQDVEYPDTGESANNLLTGAFPISDTVRSMELVSKTAEGDNTKPFLSIPVELAIGTDGKGDGGAIELEQLKFLESVPATLEIQGENLFETGATESTPVGVLKLQTGDVCLTIPVTLSDSDNEVGDPVKLKLVGDMPQAIRSGMLGDQPLQIISNPEATVRQVVTVVDPVKFAQKLLSELKTSNKQGGISGQSPNQTSEPALVEIHGGDFHADMDNQNGKSDLLSDRKLDLDRLVREWDNRSTKTGRELEKDFVKELGEKLFQTAPKSQIGYQAINKTMLKHGAESLLESSEPVKFRVHLPDVGLKITDISSFKVSIKPEYLGNVKVHLVMVDNHLTARLSVESAAARHAVEGNLPALKETLLQHGIKVENFTVNIADSGTPNRQYNPRRNTPSGKSKGEKFSFDVDAPEAISVVARKTAPGGNLSGVLNLVA